MMEKLTREIIGALSSLFANSTIEESDKASLVLIEQEIRKLTAVQKQALSQQLLQVQWPTDNLPALMIFLFDQLGDFRFFDPILETLPPRFSPQAFYEYYWNLVFRMFGSQGNSTPVTTALRQRFRDSVKPLKHFLQQQGLQQKKSVSDVKTIAILTPQLLNMRHSPTREAYSLACHLETYCRCQVIIVNTNGMSYCNDNLNLICPVKLDSNQGLKDLQRIPVDYLHFEHYPVNVLSFEPGPMTSMKIAQILDALAQLNTDAVIAHGENLMVQEAVYGVYPSLFATTGAVVPFAHCDAYFVPGNLFSEAHQQLADEYAHSNFLMESMLVTPEGKADTPMAKAQVGLAENAFLFLVVGTRLNKEVSPEFAQVCNHLLQQSQPCCILFAGTNDLDLSQWFAPEIIDSGKVVNLGFQQDLPAVCAMADVYLNPDRNGGGTSSQTAILNGMPVVTLDKGHISAVVPEQRRQNSWQTYQEYALKLWQEPEYCKAERILFEQHFAANLNTRQQVETMYAELSRIATTQYQ